MTLNHQQAKHDNEELYNDAVQSEIGAMLSHGGPMLCGQVANKVDKPPTETRWHLTELVALGEADFNWVSGLYSV